MEQIDSRRVLNVASNNFEKRLGIIERIFTKHADVNATNLSNSQKIYPNSVPSMICLQILFLTAASCDEFLKHLLKGIKVSDSA